VTSSTGTAALGFPAVWPRHNCPCPDCRDPVTGQRLVEMAAVADGLSATVTAESGDAVEAAFTPGRAHRAASPGAVPFTSRAIAPHTDNPYRDPGCGWHRATA
jgi:hypothetical protein